MRVSADRAAAHRALAVNMFGKIERLRIARPFRFYHFNDCRDDFACFFDHYRVADADVFALDFVLVVQCRARDRAATHKHRLEGSDRR